MILYEVADHPEDTALARSQQGNNSQTINSWQTISDTKERLVSENVASYRLGDFFHLSVDGGVGLVVEP